LANPSRAVVTVYLEVFTYIAKFACYKVIGRKVIRRTIRKIG